MRAPDAARAVPMLRPSASADALVSGGAGTAAGVGDGAATAVGVPTARTASRTAAGARRERVEVTQ